VERCKIDINNHIDIFEFCFRMITVPKNAVIINKTKVSIDDRIKAKISNLVRPARFWNSLHHVHSISTAK
jgi:hypothetical protein